MQLDLDSASGARSRRTRLWGEFLELASAAGVRVAGTERIRIRTPSAAALIGSGRLQQLAGQVRQNEVSLVIFNNDLKPNQERNLEKALNCRVLDRTGLILDIFSQRAISHAGRLQVELAQLTHLATRLQRGWSHLERQRGGIGLRGPGESQLELDRRMIGKRMQKIRRSLDKLRKQRQLGQKRRQKERACLVSLVGYTNAGKSTLFNALTRQQVPAADRLFETLDTSMRRCFVGGTDARLQTVVLSDTVGFISELPPQIIEAFQATLEGVTDADLLLVVEDQSGDDWQQQRAEVEKILQTIGAGAVPQLRILNKADLTDAEPGVRRQAGGLPTTLAVSALHETGIEQVRRSIAQVLSAKMGLPFRESPFRESPFQESVASRPVNMTESSSLQEQEAMPLSSRQSGV